MGRKMTLMVDLWKCDGTGKNKSGVQRIMHIGKATKGTWLVKSVDLTLSTPEKRDLQR
jgi:hypothetical protein